MSLWTKILLNLIFCFQVEASCDFRSNIKKVYSLSGPITVALRDMGLLKNPKLKGISFFNPVSMEDYAGKFYPGGLFLSKSVTDEFSGGLLFFDESRELAKTLRSLDSVQLVQVKTRSLVPHEVTDVIIKTLEPFLVGCEREVTAWQRKTNDLKAKILSKINKPFHVLFYLGEFKNGRPPEVLIVNDGVVKWLIQEKKIITYPGPLSYVNWSAKVMESLPKNTLKVAIKDSMSLMTKEVRRVRGGTVLTYPGSLVPGVTQLEALSFWLNHF